MRISHRVTENTEKKGISFLQLCTLCVSVAKIKLKGWLPDMDLNHDKQIQSLLCYRYTIGQAGAFDSLNALLAQSRFVTSLKRYQVASGGPCCIPVLTLERVNVLTN